MPELDFQQVDVFGSAAFRGNPLAVVHGADGLTDAQMAAFANWTNLSETTFLLRPTHPQADYRVRIFTPQRELPFAGHPTLGSCHAWLTAGGVPRGRDIVQECGAGLVAIRRGADGGLAFAAPPLLRSGAVEPEVLDRLRRAFGVSEDAVVASSWVDNGPGWAVVMLRSREEVLAVRPDYAPIKGMSVGLVGPWAPGGEAQFELRAFSGHGGYEDPVTGSLNASVAQWLIGAGLAPDRYVAAQGTVLGRAGRVALARDTDAVWVGGATRTCIAGRVTF